MRAALAVLAIATVAGGCRDKESVDDCMKVELRKLECWEHGKPTPAGLDFIRDSCHSSNFRAARVDEPACLAARTCEAFVSCDAPFERDNPFGQVR